MITHNIISVWCDAIVSAIDFLLCCIDNKPKKMADIECNDFEVLQQDLRLCGEIASYPKAKVFENIKKDVLCSVYDEIKEEQIGVKGSKIEQYANEIILETSVVAPEIYLVYMELLSAKDLLEDLLKPEEYIQGKPDPQQPQQGEHSEPQHTPNEKADEDYLTIKLSADMNTERARKYLGKAIKLGWIKEKNNNKLQWLDIGESVTTGKPQRLAYFIWKLYVLQPNDNVPIKACEKTFNLQEQLSPRIDKTKNHITRLRDRIDKFFDE